MTTPRDSDARDGAPSEVLASSGSLGDQNGVYSEDRPEGLRIIVAGEIDLSSHAQLEEVAARATDGAPRDVAVDLSAATFIDSTTLGFLAKLHTHVQESGHQLTLHGPHGAVMRALTVVGFDRVMTIV
jgi:anti-sigma B factor antagonist